MLSSTEAPLGTRWLSVVWPLAALDLENFDPVLFLRTTNWAELKEGNWAGRHDMQKLEYTFLQLDILFCY